MRPLETNQSHKEWRILLQATESLCFRYTELCETCGISENNLRKLRKSDGKFERALTAVFEFNEAFSNRRRMT